MNIENVNITAIQGSISVLETMRMALSEFAKEREWEQFHSLRNLVLALVGEVGELAAELQWLSDEQVATALLNSQKREAVGSELADILAYLIRIADIADFDLESELMKKLTINESRYPVDKSKGSSAKYTAYE
jgi:NTP pyrophosphatase (non-canonical NTP hydrolase)